MYKVAWSNFRRCLITIDPADYRDNATLKFGERKGACFAFENFGDFSLSFSPFSAKAILIEDDKN